MTDRRAFLKSGSVALAALSASPGSLLGRPRHASHVSGYGAVGPRPSRALDLLILGGTGFLGPHQVHLALERGHSVTVFNRGRTPPRMFVDDFDRVERLVGDRDGDLRALEGRRWDAVIDNSTQRADWAEASVELLRDAVDHYLFVSSTGVYYPYRTTGISESTPVLMEDTSGGRDGSLSYGVMKANGERATRDGFGARALVVRPGHIVGPGDTQPNRFPYWTTRMERGGEVLAPGTRSDPVQIVDVRDLIGFMLHLLEAGRGGTFNVVGPASPMSMDGFLHGIRACTGEPVSWVWIDDVEWLAERGFGAAVPWIPPRGDELGHMSVAVDRALDAGLTLRPLARTVFDVMEWWRSDAVPSELRATVRFPLGPDRERELIAAWRARG